MNRPELLEFHTYMCDRARSLMQNKNADYAGNDEPFANLDVIETLSRGKRSTEEGIIVRLADKISRLFQAVTGSLKVKDESLEDTVLDAINYSVLLAAKRQSRLNERPPQVVSIPKTPTLRRIVKEKLVSRTPIPRRERVYVAGPYSNSGKDGDSIREFNTARAKEVALLIAKRGHYVHCPHAATAFMDGDFDWDYFMDLDLSLIRYWATAVYRMNGASAGADREVALAEKLGLKVWTSMDEVPDRIIRAPL